MTKANMIEEIRKKEASLWLDLHEYESVCAPDDGILEHEITWEKNDTEYRVKLAAWFAVSELMERLGIAHDMEREEYKRASEFAHDLFIRRQTAKGIYYDERGNQIA